MVLRSFVCGIILLLIAVLFQQSVSDINSSPSKDDAVQQKRSSLLDEYEVFTSPFTSHEKNVFTQVALTMIGASTFKAAMAARMNSPKGANSSNIIVGFLVPDCSQKPAHCVDTDFEVYDQTETNFTVFATLISNRDLNDECNKTENSGRSFFVTYRGHAKRPANTAPFNNYLVVYKCGKDVSGEFGPEASSLLRFILRVLIGLVIIAAIIAAIIVVLVKCFPDAGITQRLTNFFGRRNNARTENQPPMRMSDLQKREGAILLNPTDGGDAVVGEENTAETSLLTEPETPKSGNAPAAQKRSSSAKKSNHGEGTSAAKTDEKEKAEGEESRKSSSTSTTDTTVSSDN